MSNRNFILSIVIITTLIVLLCMLLFSSFLNFSQNKNFATRAVFSSAVFELSPDDIQIAPGETRDIQISLESGEIPVSGIDLSLAFNPDIIQITKITSDTDNGFTDTLKSEIGEKSARLVLVSRKATTELPKGKLILASLTITAKNPGITPLEIRPKEVVGFNGLEQDVRIDTGAAISALINVNQEISLSPTSIPQETPLIIFKTAFVGINQSRPELAVRLKVVDELNLKPASHIYNPLLVSDDNYYYSPEESPFPLIGTEPGPGKTIYLKGPKHLQKKLVERTELVSGNNNNFDWTGELLQLEPGDLPNPANNYEQDGVVNAMDVALLVERIGSHEDGDLQVADLNYDDIVNANDLSLLIATLSTKYDDELL